MDDNEKKNIDLLRFYKKNSQEIQLKIKETILFGKIQSINFLFCKANVVLKLSDGSVIKIFLEDIEKESIFPESVEFGEPLEYKNQFHKKERKGIPKSVRLELWRNYFKQRFHGECFVCGKGIRRDDFEAGHITAVSKGGSNSLNNLRPVCKVCNLSMGTRNLNEFKKEYH